MTRPEINDAKRLAYDYRAKGVLILSFGAGRYGTASYGMTRPLCDAMKSVNEQIAELIEQGTITIPPELGTS